MARPGRAARSGGSRSGPDHGSGDRDAATLSRKARSLTQAGRDEAALGVYDELLGLPADGSDGQLREEVALELAGRVAALRRGGQHAEAVGVADVLVAHFGTRPPPGAPYVAVGAMLGKAASLVELGRADEALVVYDELVDRHGDDTGPDLRKRVAAALALKGHVLASRPGGGEPAVAVFDELVARYGEAAEPELGETVAQALSRKAAVLARLGRDEEALSAYDDLLARVDEAVGSGGLREPGARVDDLGSGALRELGMRALQGKIEVLRGLGRNDEAIVVADALVARLEADEDPGRLVLLGDTLIAKAADLVAGERWEEALEAFDAVVARLEGEDDPALRRRVVLAMSNGVVAFTQLNRLDEASATHRDMVTRFGEDAIATFEELASEFAGAVEPEQRRHAIGALVNKAGVLGELDRPDDAVAALTELIDRFEDDPDEVIQKFVAAAREQRARLLERPAGADETT
jgi:tetratricopeptide (TPR) repeat protein